MIEEVRKEVLKLLGKDNSGHDMKHMDRVCQLSLKFAEKEKADRDVVTLIALLHDVDDYKLFGIEDSEKLANAKNIMNKCHIPMEIQNQVCTELRNIGYSKLLKGHRPNTIEGKIVSDADMCDTLGANGILRTHIYTIKNGKPFFDRNIFPRENLSADKYTSGCADTCVCHMFEKILKLKKLMLTKSGKEEASKRNQIIIDFLYHLFAEENAVEWITYLKEYLEDNA